MALELGPQKHKHLHLIRNDTVCRLGQSCHLTDVAVRLSVKQGCGGTPRPAGESPLSLWTLKPSGPVNEAHTLRTEQSQDALGLGFTLSFFEGVETNTALATLKPTATSMARW